LTISKQRTFLSKIKKNKERAEEFGPLPITENLKSGGNNLKRTFFTAKKK